MNLEDESLLSAYMDGQLDPDEIHVVESALLSNPQVAEQLRSLASLRDLIGGLSRQAPVDVTFGVLERIRPGRRRWLRMPPSVRHATDRRLLSRAGGLFGIAATLMITVTIAWNRGLTSRPGNAERRPNAAHSTLALDTVRPATVADPIGKVQVSASPDQPQSSPIPASLGEAETTVPIGQGLGTTAGNDTHDIQDSRDVQHVRTLLDSPNLKRFFLVTEGRDGGARQQVASVIEQTTHVGFYKITISHGIVIDPRHPEEATVFALLVNSKELESLRDRLNAAVPNSIEESQPDPKVVTQLADIGQVQALPGTPLATIPQDSLALLAKGGNARHHVINDTQASEKPSVTAEHDRIGPVAPGRAPRHESPSAPGPSDREPTSTKGEDMIVVLVWVTKSQSG